MYCQSWMIEFELASDARPEAAPGGAALHLSPLNLVRFVYLLVIASY
jgi:hypothetical protein